MHNYRKIYVFENQDGNVKIGVSGEPEKRKKAIQNQTGYTITRTYATEDCFNPFDIEKVLHKKYESKKVFGEWFAVNYDNVIRDLDSLFQEKAKLEDDTPKSDFNLFKYFHPEVFGEEE